MFSLSSRLEKEACHPSGGQTRRQTPRLEHLGARSPFPSDWGGREGASGRERPAFQGSCHTLCLCVWLSYGLFGWKCLVLLEGLCCVWHPACWSETWAAPKCLPPAGGSERVLTSLSRSSFWQWLFLKSSRWLSKEIFCQYSVLAACSVSVRHCFSKDHYG